MYKLLFEPVFHHISYSQLKAIVIFSLVLMDWRYVPRELNIILNRTGAQILQGWAFNMFHPSLGDDLLHKREILINELS